VDFRESTLIKIQGSSPPWVSCIPKKDKKVFEQQTSQKSKLYITKGTCNHFALSPEEPVQRHSLLQRAVRWGRERLSRNLETRRCHLIVTRQVADQFWLFSLPKLRVGQNLS
jgi:hypothetical protein